jgi:hypothetical protein
MKDMANLSTVEGANVPVDAAPLAPLLQRLRRGFPAGVTALVVPPRLLHLRCNFYPCDVVSFYQMTQGKI